MRRPKDPKDPKQPNDSAGEERSPPGGRARERVDLFNRQRGLPTDSDTKKDDTREAPQTPPKTKRPEN